MNWKITGISKWYLKTPSSDNH